VIIMEPNRIWHRSITPIAVQYDKVGADAQIIGITAFHRSITSHAENIRQPAMMAQVMRIMRSADKQPIFDTL
jgi:hypothetical protein